MKTDMHFGASPELFRRARELRKHPTKAEEILWEHLRKRRMGHKFRRQHPMWICIVDFYCHYLRLIVEVDGGIHEEAEQQLKDKEKTEGLISLGLHIIRFSNEEVLFDIDNVLDKISQEISELKYHRFKVKKSN